MRNSGKKCRKFRYDSGNSKNCCSQSKYPAIDNFSRCYDTNILTVSRCRKSSEQCPQNICHAIRHDAVLQFSVLRNSVHCSNRCRRVISDGLYRINGKQKPDRNACRNLKMDSKMHKLWKLKYFCFSDT